MSLGRAQQLMDAEKYDEAVTVLGAEAGADSRDPRRAVVLARISEARGDREGALALLDRLRTARPDYAPGHLFHGIFAGDAKQFDASAAAFDRVLELQPDNDVGRSYRALAHLQQGQDAQGIELFRKHGFTDNRMFRVRLTEWMEQQWIDHDRFFGQRADSLPKEDDAVPASSVGRLRQGAIERRASGLYLKKRYAEMIHVLEPLARLPEPDDGVLFTCAFGAEMLHDYDRAMDYINRLPQDTDKWPDALLAERGRVLVRMRRFREAAADLNRVEMIGPEDYGANYYFGVLCLAHGERAQARRLFLRSHTQYLIDTLEYQWWQIERQF